MSLHRSSSTSSFSSSSSTLLLHPLDIHFLAEPYGPPPPPGPAQPDPFQMGPPEGPPPAIVSSSAYITTSFSARILEGQSSPVGGAAEDVGDSAVGGLAQYKAMSLPTAPAMPAMPTSLPTTPTSQVPMKTSNLPKVQVCGRAGVWWALNAGVLLLYRDMHARGQCSCVRAEVVPLHKVPGPLQAAMVLEQEDFSETHALLPGRSSCPCLSFRERSLVSLCRPVYVFSYRLFAVFIFLFIHFYFILSICVYVFFFLLLLFEDDDMPFIGLLFSGTFM
ncbi:uncharacterized protein LOC119582517 [Penaeus monodon]|uniref:uncharacterized protein LOC119582517 n=1 Tax=Penaeus monodon TaxID=6687 RepID=UPI0018A7DDB9|nr:uncharacterized protein LOC119582517 [Penaeus monodon]XP_037786740.1 uncharacterized protein LOC119582517 [Penaeus monodon]